MVTQETQNFVLSVVDANQEYNTKLMLFGLFFCYLLFFLWWSDKIIPFRATRDEYGKFPLYKQVSVKLMRIVPVVFLFFSFLIIGIMMNRDYALDSLLTLMITGYSVVTVVGLVIWFLFGMDWIQDFLGTIGIKTKDSSGRIIRRRDK